MGLTDERPRSGSVSRGEVPGARTEQTVRLSVVITTRDRKDRLMRCIESVKASDFSDWELIVVDDASTDATRSLEAKDLGVAVGEVIHLVESVMMVRARNVGARRARGELVLFIDDDNVIHPAMIRILVEAANAHPAYGIFGPAMLELKTGETYLDHQTMNLWTGRTRGHIDTQGRAICDTEGVPNVFMVRRRVFEECGYFDESLLQTYTEPDFSFAARAKGFRSGIVKAAVTLHDVLRVSNLTPRALGGEFRQKAYCLMRNRTVLVRRYGRWYQRVFYTLFFSWFWPLAYSVLMLRFLRFDLVSLYWRGWWDGMVYMFGGPLVNGLARWRG
ncbi:MAG TPA: glycosyltransferase family 2 protein [Verrucomicrobiae bacterium]|nr:glycosyltransferase family 2 protein [Verrucomicrobiae bacterium]